MSTTGWVLAIALCTIVVGARAIRAGKRRVRCLDCGLPIDTAAMNLGRPPRADACQCQHYRERREDP